MVFRVLVSKADFDERCTGNLLTESETLAFNLHIKLAIRFSYFGTSGFKMSQLPPKALEAQLYEPDRLARRFALFEALTLPTLKAQECPEFSTAVLIGEGFPEEARQYLERLLADLPGASIVALPPMGNYTAMQQVFARMPTAQEATHVATVRLDDDDALHREGLRRIDEIATSLSAVRNPREPLVIGFNRGFFLDFTKPGLDMVEVHEKTPLGIGLALVTPKASPLNIYRRNHRLLPQFFDCYTDVSQPMFVRSVHQYNDSAAFASGQVHPVVPEERDDMLRAGFDLSWDTLSALAE